MRPARDLILSILDEARFLERESRGLDGATFAGDSVRKRAFARSVEIMGEAVKAMPAEVVTAHPEVEWRRIAGMRDRLIHGYFAVDYSLLLEVATRKAPELIPKLEAILKSFSRP